MKSKVKNLMFFCSLLPLLALNSDKQEVFLSDKTTTPDDHSHKVDSLIKFAEKYLKRPYCFNSKPPKCFDCSGFVQYCFQHFGKELPHSSNSSAFLGKFVSTKHAQKGDLIFFTGSNSKTETVGHVGIITETIEDRIYFIHASVKSGVIISNSEESYYKKRYLLIKRIRF